MSFNTDSYFDLYTRSETHSPFQLKHTVSIVAPLSPIVWARVSFHTAHVGINIISVAQDLGYEATIASCVISDGATNLALKIPRDIGFFANSSALIMLAQCTGAYSSCRR